MANLNAILKNKMGLSAEQAKKSKVLASLSGSYRQNMKSIHYTQLVSNINQFYSEKELENLADVIQILGGVAQNLLVRKKDAEQYEILAGHRRWRASQIVVQRGFPEYAYLPCLVIECNDDVAELLLILTNSSARTETVTACTTCQHNLMRFWRIEICHITDIYEKQKDYSVLKNEEKYMIEKVYDDNTLSFKEKGLYTAIYLNETMNVDQLVESGKDKADAVRSGLKKLIEKQYIKKSVVREKNGNFVTVYYQVIE